jgi:hypothetical protein
MELKNYLSEEKINNIYDRYSNVFVAFYDENAKQNGKYVAQLLAKVNIKKDKAYIKNGDFIEFKTDKVKWKDKKIVVVDPHWVSPYMNEETLPINVKILKSKVVDNIRQYYESYEIIELTYKQFIKRRLLEDYANVKHLFMEAYSNFQDRRVKVGYYQALNETSKHYRIEHDQLKNGIIPRVNNSLKQYKKEWQDLYIRSLKQNKAIEAIDNLIKSNKEKSAVIPLR